MDDVLALPSFLSALEAIEAQEKCRIEQLPLEAQDDLILGRLAALVDVCRVNPLWRARINDSIGDSPLNSFAAYQALPILDKDSFRDMFTGTRPGMVVPIDRCGFQIVASGGTSSGQPSETVYPLNELQDTYQWAGAFMGRHMMSSYLNGKCPKWVMTTLADYQMWSSGTMVGGVLQKIPGVNYIGAGPVSPDVFRLIMSYPGPKAIMGITRSIEFLPAFSEGLSQSAREDLRIILYGSGVLTPKVRSDLKISYPNAAILSYFAATQAETIGLQLNPDSPILTAVPGLHLIEVVDADGHWVAPGEEGELVVTRLFGNAAPVLRYKIGDRVLRRENRVGPDLNAIQFEYVGRSGDFMHIGDTQYSASRALEAICGLFQQNSVLDIDAIAANVQFHIRRSCGEFYLLIAAADADALTQRVAERVGAQGTAPLIMTGLARSLSVFNALEANEASLRHTGYRFGIKIVDPSSPEIIRTELGKIPLVIDEI